MLYLQVGNHLSALQETFSDKFQAQEPDLVSVTKPLSSSCNISNTRKSVSIIRYPNTEKWVEKTRRSRVFFNQLRSVWISDETFCGVFDIASQSINDS